jgi:hypothetical protein
MTPPTKLAIFASERRLQEARRDIHDRVCRLRTAVNTRLTRPSTIFGAAGLGALVVFALSSHRHTPRRVRADRATVGSIGAIVAAFVARQAWQELSRLVIRWVTQKERSPRFPRRDEALHASDHLTRPSSTRRVMH